MLEGPLHSVCHQYRLEMNEDLNIQEIAVGAIHYKTKNSYELQL